MKIKNIENYLEVLSIGTGFTFSADEAKNEEVDLFIHGDNPCDEDWCIDITIKNPKTKKELVKILHNEFLKLYEDFDVEEETYLMLEAKRNGFRGVPDVVDLVHNEEYKENTLKEFAEKLRDLC